MGLKCDFNNHSCGICGTKATTAVPQVYLMNEYRMEFSS